MGCFFSVARRKKIWSDIEPGQANAAEDHLYLSVVRDFIGVAQVERNVIV